jgi:hypothetical protein
MRKIIDLIGLRFGKLIVVEYVGESNWKAECDCGEIKIVDGASLRKGHTKSCGCGRINDLSGKKFGKLLVIKRVENNEFGKAQFLCRCDCGNQKNIVGASLYNGWTKSCGCLHRDLMSLPEGEGAFNVLFEGYKYRANRLKISFCITKSLFAKLTKMSCYYCGIEPNQRKVVSNGNGIYIYNGLDRVDSMIGYEERNVVPCCGTCNKAKMAMSREDFLSWVERVYKHSIGGKEK